MVLCIRDLCKAQSGGDQKTGEQETKLGRCHALPASRRLAVAGWYFAGACTTAGLAIAIVQEGGLFVRCGFGCWYRHCVPISRDLSRGSLGLQLMQLTLQQDMRKIGQFRQFNAGLLEMAKQSNFSVLLVWVTEH